MTHVSRAVYAVVWPAPVTLAMDEGVFMRRDERRADDTGLFRIGEPAVLTGASPRARFVCTGRVNLCARCGSGGRANSAGDLGGIACGRSSLLAFDQARYRQDWRLALASRR